jgi:adenylate cyclase
VAECLSVMSTCTAEVGGRVIKTIGDAVLAVFRTADDAALAAAEMHRRVAALGIGFRFGPVVGHDGDVFGDTVNLASRLCDLASRGQIVTDGETSGRLTTRFASERTPLFAVPVKGKEEEVEVIELAWQSPSVEKTLIFAKRPASAAAPPAALRLRLADREFEIGSERRKLTIGRDADSDIAIGERAVSRSHAVIERRRDHFVLTDHSANGSYVTFDGRPEFRVHHEELTLAGRGVITFGQARAEGAPVVEFSGPG